MGTHHNPLLPTLTMYPRRRQLPKHQRTSRGTSQGRAYSAIQTVGVSAPSNLSHKAVLVAFLVTLDVENVVTNGDRDKGRSNIHDVNPA